MKTKMLPFFSVLYLFVFLGIQMTVTMITMVAMMAIRKDFSLDVASDPVLTLVSLSASAVITIAVFLLTKWAVLSKNYPDAAVDGAFLEHYCRHWRHHPFNLHSGVHHMARVADGDVQF